MNRFDFSVIILSYRAEWKKLKLSIMSAIKQDYDSFEIIITDDGSDYNYFIEIEELFEQHAFVNYKLIPHEYNIGTVKSLLSAVSVAEGRYIKPLGVGDFLCDANVLSSLTHSIKEVGYFPSILVSDVLNYYFNDKQDLTVVKRTAIPQITKCYNNSDKVKFQILALEDAPGGPSLIYKKDDFIDYLYKASGKIRLAEDLLVKLMIADDRTIIYISKPVVMYEIGTGITSSPKASELMLADRKALNLLLLPRCKKYRYYKQMEKNIKAKTNYISNPSRLNYIKWIFSCPQLLLFNIRKKLFPRFTSENVSKDFIQLILEG